MKLPGWDLSTKMNSMLSQRSPTEQQLHVLGLSKRRSEPPFPAIRSGKTILSSKTRHKESANHGAFAARICEQMNKLCMFKEPLLECDLLSICSSQHLRANPVRANSATLTASNAASAAKHFRSVGLHRKRCPLLRPWKTNQPIQGFVPPWKHQREHGRLPTIVPLGM